MAFDPMTAILDLGKSAIDKIWPDPIKRAEELRKLEELKQNGDIAQLNAHVQLMLGQLNVNKIEAQHKSLFVAGWRPWIGWVGGFSLAYAGLVYPLLTWLLVYLEATGRIPAGMDAPPYIETGILGTIVTGMLGIGSMRSFDKSKGTQTDAIR